MFPRISGVCRYDEEAVRSPTTRGSRSPGLVSANCLREAFARAPAMRNDAGMRCDVAREALSARLDGERPEVLAQQVDAHLESCRGCRTWLIGAAAQTRRLASIAPGRGPDLVDQIMASVGAQSAAYHRSMRWV